MINSLPIPSAEMVINWLGAVMMSSLGTALILRSGKKYAMDSPDGHRKTHSHAVPRLGGVPVFLTLLVGFGLATVRFPSFFNQWWPVILTNTLIFAIGFADDLKPLGARVKLLGQIGCACILYSLDVSIDLLTSPFSNSHIVLGIWSLPVTILWLIAIPNIINLIDGMDGLAAGFGLCMTLVLAFVGHFSGRADVVLICVIMSGALAGFLLFNLPPAKIFLGDGGAYLIGFFIASVSLESSTKGSILAALLVMIVALGVPILDTFFAIARRGIRGVPLFRADAEHIHHRLMLLGFSKAKALLAMYSVCVVLSLVGVSILISKGRALPVAAAGLFLMALLSARYLGYVKSWSALRFQLGQALSRRQEMLYAASWAKVLEWEADRTESAEAFVRLLDQSLSRIGIRSSPFEGGLPASLNLATGQTCRLYVPSGDGLFELWLGRADFFASALNRALERWKALPGLEISSPSHQGT